MAGVQICLVTPSINSTGIMKKLLKLKGWAAWVTASQSLGSPAYQSPVSNPQPQEPPRQSKEQVLDSIKTPAWEMEECANSHLSGAGAACCYGLGHLSRLFQHSYAYTTIDKVTNEFPGGKQLTSAKETFSFAGIVKHLPEQPKLYCYSLFQSYRSLYLEVMGGLPVHYICKDRVFS